MKNNVLKKLGITLLTIMIPYCLFTIHYSKRNGYRQQQRELNWCNNQGSWHE
jgi:hypothetical protein